MSALLHRLAARFGPRTPVAPEPPVDPLHEHLQAAVAAEARAKRANVETYQSRVEAMIEDFFAKYGSRDVRPLD